MRLLKLLAIACLMMAANNAHAQNPYFWIYLCFGQSNMAGQAPIEPQDTVVPDNFLSLSAVNGTDGREIGKWRKAVPPICRQDSHLSPLDYFGRAMVENLPKRAKVGVVSVAVEGCPIDFFDKDMCRAAIDSVKRDWMNNILDQYDRNPWQRLVDMAHIAKRDGVIKGILLHQGETDAYNPQWCKKVRKIYYDLINELQLDSTQVPLIVGEVVSEKYGGICAGANKTINTIHDYVQYAQIVSSDGCQPSSDKLHFSSEGYRVLGRRYALKTLQGQGFEVTNNEHYETETYADQANRPTVEVRCQINDRNGAFTAKSNEPLKRMEVVSYSGKTIKDMELFGAKEVNLDLNTLPQERLVFVFYAENGAESSIQIEN